MAKFLFLFSVFLLNVYLTEQSNFLSKDYIAKINQAAKTWKVKLYK